MYFQVYVGSCSSSIEKARFIRFVRSAIDLNGGAASVKLEYAFYDGRTFRPCDAGESPNAFTLSID